jgi:glycerol-1-phosphate dehydrogenase [NAD(P)+]
MKLLRSGLGDMLAKYISICEWRIAHILLGEYYCEEIADLVRGAVAQCVTHADGLLRREKDAVMAVFEGLVIGGVAMNYAGLSRPASGVEHYISHVLDMRAVEFGEKAELHGLQCAAGTYIAAGLYEKLQTLVPDPQKALAAAAAFRYEIHSSLLRDFFGKGAESMIALEAREQKYDIAAHAARLEHILNKWEDILFVVRQEIPSVQRLDALYDAVGLPKTLEEVGGNTDDLPVILRCTKDIRDKYVLSRLAWDLGEEATLFD